MAIIKAVSSRASIGKAIKYITQEEKTEEKLISGIECSPQSAIEEMKITKEMWGKTGGRQYKHYIHSFSPDEKINPEKAHDLANELCKERFKGHEIIIATHKDKEHIHSHIIVNSVNYQNGSKLQESKKDLESMKEHCNELSLENGLSVPVKGDEITSYSINKYKALERGITSNYKSYVLECYKAVSEVKERATSREDFIKSMKEKGFDTIWKDTRKNITFQDQKGHKVRNSKLTKDFKEPFGKEDFERGFEINLERARAEERARKELAGAKELIRRTEQDPTRAIIGELNTTIKDTRDAISTDDSKRRNRIAKEESLKSERNRVEKQRVSPNSSKDYGHER